MKYFTVIIIVMLFLGLLVASLSIYMPWKFNYIDLNSYRQKSKIVVLGFSIRELIDPDNDQTKWANSIRYIPGEKWKLRFGNPIIGRGCALGSGERSSQAIHDIYLMSQYNPTLGKSWLEKLDNEPYPLSSKFTNLISDALQNEIEDKIRKSPNESLHRTEN